MMLTETMIADAFGLYYWPFVRIAAILMVAPVFSASMVAPQARIMIAVALTLVVAPLLEPPTIAVNPLSLAGALLTIQQLLIGVALGFALQMVFDALIIAGQAMAMSMGLGFAVAIDPQRGVNVPVVSQYFVMMATLMFLALNGHLMVVQLVVDSFQSLPVDGGGLLRDGAWQLVTWGSDMFQGALRVALPAMVALLIVNLSFGVISRSAPALNLFAIGFPLTLTLGFVIIMVALPGAMTTFMELLNGAFGNAAGLLGAGRTP